jgi:hypothetical protein
MQQSMSAARSLPCLANVIVQYVIGKNLSQEPLVAIEVLGSACQDGANRLSRIRTQKNHHDGCSTKYNHYVNHDVACTVYPHRWYCIGIVALMFRRLPS